MHKRAIRGYINQPVTSPVVKILHERQRNPNHYEKQFTEFKNTELWAFYTTLYFMLYI